MRYIRAAGGIVTRQSDSGSEIVIVHRPRYDDWSLPKGKLEQGESWQEAALREVEEEIQCHVRLGEFAGPILYRTSGGMKLTLFWRMACVEERTFGPNREIDAIRWLPVEAALTELKYADEKKLLRSQFDTA